MKRLLSILLALAMICGLLPAAVMTANAEHEHFAATDVWIQDSNGHWNPCYGGDGSCEEKLNYSTHKTGEYSKFCDVCGRIPHTCFSVNADCTYGSNCDYCPYAAPINPNKHRGRYAVSIDDNNHKIVCYCGKVYVKSEPHQFNHWDDVEGQPDIEESWCDVAGCMHVATRKKQHTHNYSKANCVSPAKCSCGATKGSKDASNHTGGTEIKGAIAATTENKGYTGDTYCKGCGTKIKTGEAIPKKNTASTAAGVSDITDTLDTTGTNDTPDTSGTKGTLGAEGTPNTSDTENITSEASLDNSATPDSDVAASESGKENSDTDITADKDLGEDASDSDSESLMWLWILLALLVAGGAVAAVVFVKKKQRANK